MPDWLLLQDGGDPAVQVSPRDKLYTMDAEASTSGREATVVAETDLRCTCIPAVLGSNTQLRLHAWLPCRHQHVLRTL